MVDYTRPDRNKPTSPPPADSGPPPSYAKSAPASGRPVDLTKVTLTKNAPTVSLTKQGSATGQVRVNLNWNARPAGGGSSGGFMGKLMGGGSKPLDLDLGCLYELTNGAAGVIQALGRAFGRLDEPPYIMLDGDDRSGTNVGGENLLINLNQLSQIRRILVFAYIYEGAPSWDQAQGVVTLHPASGPEIEIRLDEQASGARFCAIAMFENNGGDLSLRREVRYIQGSQSDVDRAYGFGLRWSAGSK